MAVAFEIIYTISDDSNEKSTTTIKVPSTFNLSDYAEFAADMAELIDVIVQGKIESADLCLAVDISGLASNTAGVTSDVEELAAFVFETGEGRKVQLNVPGINDLFVVAGSDDLDLADGAVDDVVQAMLSGLSTAGGTIIPCDRGEGDITTLVNARERFRASGTRRS